MTPDNKVVEGIEADKCAEELSVEFHISEYTVKRLNRFARYALREYRPDTIRPSHRPPCGMYARGDERLPAPENSPAKPTARPGKTARAGRWLYWAASAYIMSVTRFKKLFANGVLKALQRQHRQGP